ncbi:hypothetical protein F9B85_03365 [Heliorestis acidaminivorans]|uniref:Replicative DNA helicase n=1 Tax=Heliorestis acidaminivorans TaxID=553427 RepID=A0A6I0F4C0_9FIRM|nr:hypothetical protein [Heliorestis acidaminivorans]KAB2953672.1 hypothetical protein F9B85_03365 [Heliorestis acidaminivorans]
MDELTHDALRGYGERYKRLAIFMPLFQLKSKRKGPFGESTEDSSLDWFGLGLLTLLFFFESMLRRRSKQGAKELAQYLFQVTNSKTQAPLESYHDIAHNIIESFRDSRGLSHEERFFNWEKGLEENYRFTILKAEKYDKKANRQYFTLAPAGLELVFATKEFFSEFRISINQLLVRKRLEKGEFANALHEINEMRVSVEALREEIERVSKEVKRNIISEEIYKKYEETLQDTYDRLEREDEEFQELYAFALDTKKKIELHNQSEKDEQAYKQINKVTLELSDVHSLHRLLLRELLQLKSTTLESARQALYSMGMQYFNFDQDINGRIVSSPLPPLATKGLLAPFLRPHQQQNWSLFSLFAEQRLYKSGEEAEPQVYPEADPDAEKAQKEHLKRQAHNFKLIMEQILAVIGNKSSFELKELINHLPTALLEHRSFYDFWLLLHQRSPLTAQQDKEEHLFDSALALIEGEEIIVTECPEKLQVTERYSIQNMRLERRRINL